MFYTLNKKDRGELQLVTKDISTQLQPFSISMIEFQKDFREVYSKPIKAIQESARRLVESFTLPVGLIESLREVGKQQKGALALKSVTAPSLTFELPNIGYIPSVEPETYHPPNYDVIEELEYLEESVFDTTVTVEGRFIHEGHMLRAISTNSKHGKLFKMLLVNENNYVTDSEIKKNIGVVDEDKGIGYIRKDLAKCLRKDDLEVDLYRERRNGYRLVGIKKISN